MEDAETLSDYVVILSRGRAVESGTLHQLKLKFGVGTQIRLTKKQQPGHNLSLLSVENEQFLVLDSVSEDAREALDSVEFRQLDSFSMILETGHLSDAQLRRVLDELTLVFAARFYIAVNSCSFDDVFREIDRVYEQGAGGGDDSQTRAVFGSFVDYAKSNAGANPKPPSD